MFTDVSEVLAASINRANTTLVIEATRAFETAVNFY
jgi:hypothetical protein